MTEEFRPLTLDQIKELYPPQKQEIALSNGGTLTSSISRNLEGTIVYVVPGSTKWIKEPPKRGREPTE